MSWGCSLAHPELPDTAGGGVPTPCLDVALGAMVRGAGGGWAPWSQRLFQPSPFHDSVVLVPFPWLLFLSPWSRRNSSDSSAVIPSHSLSPGPGRVSPFPRAHPGFHFLLPDFTTFRSFCEFPFLELGWTLANGIAFPQKQSPNQSWITSIKSFLKEFVQLCLALMLRDGQLPPLGIPGWENEG